MLDLPPQPQKTSKINNGSDFGHEKFASSLLQHAGGYDKSDKGNGPSARFLAETQLLHPPADSVSCSHHNTKPPQK